MRQKRDVENFNCRGLIPSAPCTTLDLPSPHSIAISQLPSPHCHLPIAISPFNCHGIPICKCYIHRHLILHLTSQVLFLGDPDEDITSPASLAINAKATLAKQYCPGSNPGSITFPEKELFLLCNVFTADGDREDRTTLCCRSPRRKARPQRRLYQY